MTTDYVGRYRRLDDKAAKAEGQAETYRQRADADRWEQCRIAHEALDSGEYTRTSFGKAVGKHQTTISRQAAIWERWGHAHAHDRPSYSDAWAEVTGDPVEARTARSAATHIRRMPATDKAKLAAELLEDEEVATDPIVTRAAGRVHRDAADREAADEFRRTEGVHPDDIPVESFAAELMAEAVLIVGVIDGARSRVARLLDRAEPDQRPALLDKIRPVVQRLADTVDAGAVTVPDYVPDDL
jgi:hypothetical protein